MQFTERNPVIMGIIALVLLVVVGVVSLSLQRSDFAGAYSINAELRDANGLRTGDLVTVAGVEVGQVAGLEIAGDHVLATLAIEGAELTSDTRAVVTPRTLVGKRAVELFTGEDFEDTLGEGDTIPLERTEVYADVPQFGDVSEELLSEVDAEALNTFLSALTDLTRGQRDEVATLVEGGTRLTSLVNEQEGQIRELLRRLRDVSATLNRRDDELVNIIDNLDVVLGDLAERREDIRRLFRETNATSATAADLVGGIRGELDQVLEEVHRDLAIIDRHQMDLAEALAYAPDSIGGFASIAFAGPTKVPYGHVLVQSLGPAGLDVVAGCGGLVDQQLDQILGPDPRSCEEQENDTFPDDTPPPEGGPGLPGLPVLPPGDGGAAQDTGGRTSIDALGRRLLPGGGGR